MHPDDDNLSLRRRIAALRTSAGLNQGELAALCRMARAYIGLIESGARFEIGVPKLLAIAHVLGASLDWLVAGQGLAPLPEAVYRAVERARHDPASVRAAVDRALGPRPARARRLRTRPAKPTLAKGRPRRSLSARSS